MNALALRGGVIVVARNDDETPESHTGFQSWSLRASLGQPVPACHQKPAPSQPLSTGLPLPQVLLYPSKGEGMFVQESLIFRSDSNGEDLEGYAGAGAWLWRGWGCVRAEAVWLRVSGSGSVACERKPGAPIPPPTTHKVAQACHAACGACSLRPVYRWCQQPHCNRPLLAGLYDSVTTASTERRKVGPQAGAAGPSTPSRL